MFSLATDHWPLATGFDLGSDSRRFLFIGRRRLDLARQAVLDNFLQLAGRSLERPPQIGLQVGEAPGNFVAGRLAEDLKPRAIGKSEYRVLLLPLVNKQDDRQVRRQSFEQSLGTLGLLR